MVFMDTRASSPLEFRFAVDAKLGVFEGYGSTFNDKPDDYGDVIAPGASTKSLSRHKQAGTLPVMLWSHDPAAVIGRWLEMREDARGLFAKGQLNLETTAGRDAFAHLKAGDISGLSIGFRVPAGGRERMKDGAALLKQIELIELSLVAMPANESARVTSVKSIASRVELERLLHKAGLPRAAAAKVAAGGWPALSKDPAPELSDLVERVKAATIELRNPK